MTIKDTPPSVEKPRDDTTMEPNLDLFPDIASPSDTAPIEDLSLPIVSKPCPPHFQAVQRGNDDDNEKCCRICLEDDYPQHMIAPCKCKGSSKWVHRQCLDQWRINETDRAFSKCTECLFVYHMQPVPSPVVVPPPLRRRVKYTLLVTRDVCLVTLYLQLAIAFLGWIVACIDSDRELPRLMESDMPVVVYYLFGFLAVLIILGFCGMMLCCCNECSVQQTLALFPGNNGTFEQPTYQERSSHYQQSRQHSQNRDGCCTNCCLGCGSGSPPSPTSYYYIDPNGCCDLCLCCCDAAPSSSGAAASAASSSGNGNSDCCNGCDGDGAVILLFILLALAVFLAIIGFFIGVVLCVIIFQRTLQRHIHILHKRQLVREFQVMDLAGYDLDQPLDNYGSSTDVEQPQSSSAKPRPTAPTLAEHDAKYLKDLGLLEEVGRPSWSSTTGVLDD